MCRKPILISFLILGFLLPVFSQNNILLQFRPPEGMKFLTVYETQNINEQEVMGIDQKVEMNSVIETETIVLESNEKNTLLSISYKRLFIETISPSVDFSIDTNADEDQPGYKYLKALTGKPFRVLINRNGEIVDITGLEEVMSKIIAEVDTTTSVFANFKTTISTFFEKEQVKNNLTQMNPVFPDNKVGIGDTWNYRINSIAGQFEFISSNTARLIDLKKERAILQIDSKVSVPEKLSLNLQGVNAIVNLSGTEVAEISVDKKTGLTTEGIKKQNINAIMHLDMSDRGQKDLEIPMKITTSTDLEVIF